MTISLVELIHCIFETYDIAITEKNVSSVRQNGN